MTKSPQISVYPQEDDSSFPFRLFSTGQGRATVNCHGFQQSNYQHYLLEYVLDGTGYIETGDFSAECHTGDLYMLHKGRDHAFWHKPEDPWEKIFMIVEGGLAKQLVSAYKLDEVYHVPEFGNYEHFERMHELFEKADPDVHRKASMIFHELVHTIAAAIPVTNQNLPQEIIKVKNYIDYNLEQKITLKKLARLAGSSEAHLIRTFKKAFGQTPYDYLARKRIELAKHLLVNTYLPIKGIAEMLKFSDQYYFSNYFRRKAGVSPKHYRDSFKLPAKP